MKTILFIDSYEGIRDIFEEQVAHGGGYQGFKLELVSDFSTAKEKMATTQYHGIIMDGLQSPLETVLDFIQTTRAKWPQQSMLALLSSADIGLNSDEKTKIMELKVSVANKVHALSSVNIEELFNLGCTRGFGEELCS